MSEELGYVLQITSTFSVVLPLALGCWYARAASLAVRGFLFLLFIGFMVDLSGWYFYLTHNADANLYVRHFYDLFETLAFIWFLNHVTSRKLLKKILKWAPFPIVLFWASRFANLEFISVYKASTEVAIAFTAAFILIEIVERNQRPFRIVVFWILIGLFFYCFTTYFLMGLLYTNLGRVWYAHTVVNIVTNLIYCIGPMHGVEEISESSPNS